MSLPLPPSPFRFLSCAAYFNLRGIFINFLNAYFIGCTINSSDSLRQGKRGREGGLLTFIMMLWQAINHGFNTNVTQMRTMNALKNNIIIITTKVT